MAIYHGSKAKLFLGSQKIKKGYLGATKIYSSGNIVTYVVHGENYTQEFDEGESVLSPSVVTPTLSGATFLGWSTSPSSTSVVTSLVMGDEPISLYAVFKYTDVTVTSANGTYSFYDQKPLDRTEKLFVLDTSKYASHTVVASVQRLSCGNTTTANVTANAYVDGTLVRSVTVAPNSGPVTENSGYIGTGGKSFTITHAGDLTIRAVLPSYPWERYCEITISSLKLNGKTVVG